MLAFFIIFHCYIIMIRYFFLLYFFIHYFRHFSSSACHWIDSAYSQYAPVMAATHKEAEMIRARFYVVEVAAQLVLAAAIGLFVSIALAGMALLLAA